MNGKVEASTIFLDGEWWEKGRRSKQLLSQKFGTVLSDEDFSNSDVRFVQQFISRPRMPASMKASGASEWNIVDGRFQFSIELDEFEMENLHVKRIGKYVEVHGKHEEKEDQYGLVSREFCRRFRLPDDCKIKAVTSVLSDGNKLTIMAPMGQEQLELEERIKARARELQLREPEFNPSLTEIEQEDFDDYLEMCREICDTLLKTDQISVELAAALAEYDSEPDMHSREKWSLLKKKLTELDETKEDTVDINIIDNMLKETHEMFSVHRESSNASVDGSMADTTVPPKSPVEPKAIETEQSIQQ